MFRANWDVVVLDHELVAQEQRQRGMRAGDPQRLRLLAERKERGDERVRGKCGRRTDEVRETGRSRGSCGNRPVVVVVDDESACRIGTKPVGVVRAAVDSGEVSLDRSRVARSDAPNVE